MRFLFVGIFALTVVSVVYSKIIFENYVSNSNPNYVKESHEIKVVDGLPYVTLDMWVLKDAPTPMYTAIIHKKDATDYQEVLRMGPFDPCIEDITSDPQRMKHHEEMMKYGNASLNQICPFQQGYTYLKNAPLDLTEELPPHMPSGQYKVEIKATVKEDGADVMLLDEELYIKIE